MTASDAAIEDGLRAAMESIPEVRVAYLFGSRATGRARPDSDLDIAVKVDAGRDAAHGPILLRVVDAITAQLGSLGERADVLDLDAAGSAVAFRVIREGRRFLSRDERERVRLEAWIARRYDDEAPHRALFRRAAVEAGRRMAGSGSG